MWDGIAPVPYQDDLLPSPIQLDELLRQRRTVRHFEERKIARVLLEEIVGYGILSPTNNYSLRAIVVDDGEAIEALEDIVLRIVTRIYNILYKPKLIFSLLALISSAFDRKDKVKMEETIAAGRNLATTPAAAVFIVGDRRVALSESSAQYALYNMILYAQTKGIGSCLRGTGQMILDKSGEARSRLGLEKHERIFGAVLLGYPTVRFRNKVYGKTMPIEWITGSSQQSVLAGQETFNARETHHVYQS
jgi:nitroreductase